MPLKAICRLQTFKGRREKEVTINSFVHSDFKYGCFIWHLTSKNSQNKVEKIMKGV